MINNVYLRRQTGKNNASMLVKVAEKGKGGLSNRALPPGSQRTCSIPAR